MSTADSELSLIQRDSLANIAAACYPENATQQLLEGIWSAVLGIDRLSIDDDFFDMGGTSDKAAEIFSRIQVNFSVTLPLSSLYNASTIRQLGELIEAADDTGKATSVKALSNRLVSMSAASERPPLFMIPGIFGNSIALANIARSLGDSQPIYGLDAQGPDGTSELLYDMHAIALEHARLIEQQYDGPYYLLGVCYGGLTALEVAHILQNKGKVVVFLGLVDPMTVSLPELKPNKVGKITPLSLLTFFADQFNYWRKRFRKQRMRDRLGILTAHDQLDPQRAMRRKLKASNVYAGRRYKPMACACGTHLFLTRDAEEGRKKDGRKLWIELLDLPRDTLEYIPGNGPGYLLSAEGAPGFAATLRAQLDATLAKNGH
jgi:pimeloyl-ACP methyl ester carboxylesterase